MTFKKNDWQIEKHDWKQYKTAVIKNYSGLPSRYE